MSKSDFPDRREQLLDEAASHLRTLVTEVEGTLGGAFTGLNDGQIIALAHVARAASLSKGALAVLHSGCEREVAPFYRMLIELVIRFTWLLGDGEQRAKRLDLFRHKVLLEHWDNFNQTAEHLPASSRQHVDMAVIEKKRDDARAAYDKSDAEIRDKYPELKDRKKVVMPGLADMAKAIGKEDLYRIAYHHISLQEHSDGWFLATHIDRGANTHSFTLAEKDEQIVSWVAGIHEILVHVAGTAFDFCPGVLDENGKQKLSAQRAAQLTLQQGIIACR